MRKFKSKYMLGACIVGSIVSAGAAAQVAAINNTGRAEAMSAWETTLKHEAPAMEGCFSSTFPDMGWQAVRCGAPPKLVMKPRHVASGNVRTTTDNRVLITGNGDDYAARTGRLTHSAVGSFPSVSGVTTGVVNTRCKSIPTTTATPPLARSSVFLRAGPGNSTSTPATPTKTQVMALTRSSSLKAGYMRTVPRNTMRRVARPAGMLTKATLA